MQRCPMSEKFCILFSRILVVILLAWPLSGCSKSCSTAPAVERVGDAFRLTSGAFREEQVRFHPEKPRLLAVRSVSESKKDVRESGQEWETHIMEVDFSDPERPEIREIKALAGGNYPSYAAGDGIVALDIRGRLVILKTRSGEAEGIVVSGIRSRPAKPVVSPDGARIAFLALPEVSKEAEPLPMLPTISRHEAYIAPTDGGEARRISKAISPSALLVSAAWAEAGHLFLTYDVIDPNTRHTRVEIVDIETGKGRLALFADYPADLAIAPSGLFFATAADKENMAAFLSRGMEKKKQVDLENEVLSLTVGPAERWAAAVRYCPDTKGANLFLLPVPEEFNPQ